MYPPPTHVLRDMAMTIDRRSETHTITTLPNTAICHDRHGHYGIGEIAIAVDVAAAGIALSSVAPDWIATVDLSFTYRAALTAETVRVEVVPVRAGSKLVVVGADIYNSLGNTTADGGDSPAATAFVTFTRIPGTATASERPNFSPGILEMEPSAEQLRGTLADRFQYGAAAPGELSMMVHDYVRNSFGAPNGGVVAHLLSSAATHWADASPAVDEGLVLRDLHVRYLAQAKTGPVTTRVEPQRIDAAGASVLVSAHEADRLVANATIRLDRVD